MKKSSKGKLKYRVALMGIYHESNTFIEKKTTRQDFINSHLLYGDEIRKEYADAHHEIGGMLEVLDRHQIETIPILFAEATPGGIISKDTYENLLKEMTTLLQEQLPVDGCMVIPHGAGVAEGYPDMDGNWLSVIRKLVKNYIPIIGTLDPHANISPLMTSNTTALVAYKTNPHIDQRDTGRAAAELLVNCLRKNISPLQQLIQTPVAISIEQQNTSAEPCKGLYKKAELIAENPRVLSVSILLGFPYADVNEMGSAFLVVTDDLPDLALSLGNHLKMALMEIKEKCIGSRNDIADILPFLKGLAKPVLLLDMGDNIGGGSPGDSCFLLKALETYGTYKSFFCIYDPQAVETASAYQPDESFDLHFGNQDGIPGGKPYFNLVTLLSIVDGKFRETTPRHGGQVNYDMGKTVLLKTAGRNLVMLNSLRVPPFSLSQLTSFCIFPKDFDVVTAKGVNSPIAAYGTECATIIQINSPGVTQADMTQFTYHNRRRPLYPFEN